MADESFDIKKWFTGFVNPVTWSKSVVYLAMILIVLLIGFTIYRAYFMKTGSNLHRPTIIALPGSTVTNPDMHSEQKIEQQKRPWWRPIPYISVYGVVQTTPQSKGQVKFDDWSPGIGSQAGIRWDF